MTSSVQVFRNKPNHARSDMAAFFQVITILLKPSSFRTEEPDPSGVAISFCLVHTKE